MVVSFFLTISELLRWHHRHETHQFSVEKGIGHELQINLDIVVAMACGDLHVNVQDSSGDRILAGEMLKHDETNWEQWVKGMHELGWGDQNAMYDDETEHLAEIIGGRESKWGATPKLRNAANACRIFGDLKLNKVQGDFHITARGHGYMEWGQHLDHQGNSLHPVKPIHKEKENK
jgi:endoplasmic reticulum-Golgi intermediate compartment protein 2